MLYRIQIYCLSKGGAMGKSPGTKINQSGKGWPLFELWSKYEDIAMHFNDLLLKLRTQALAAVTALGTLIGLLAKPDAGSVTNWPMVAAAFAILCAFWVAIWVLDFFYYNRLLLGAAKSLLEIEEISKTSESINEINLSTNIRKAVLGKSLWKMGTGVESRGRWLFYGIVFLTLIVCFYYAICQANPKLLCNICAVVN